MPSNQPGRSPRVVIRNLERVRPPIRWAGSKRSLLPWLAKLAPTEFDRYVEPFAGSAALFFALAPASAQLGDINEDLVRFYRVLSSRPGAVARAMSRFAPDGDDYYRVRSLSVTGLSDTMAAARFLYLNRFCFNGVYRTNRKGEFNVPRGSKTGAVPQLEELHSAARMLRRADIHVADFETTLDAARPGDFVYIDPPYFTRRGIKPGEYGYGSLVGADDMRRLAAAVVRLSGRGVRYLLSYSDSRTLIRLLNPVFTTRVRVRRSVGGHEGARKQARELIMANYSPDAGAAVHD
jgi:DNA adenine methylase